MCVASLLAMLFAAVGCGENKNTYRPQHLSGVIWGTEYHITYNPADLKRDIDISALVTDALLQVDSAANAFNPSSELSRLNGEGLIAFPSIHLQRLIDLSRHINDVSNGAFDPTVGPLVDAWGFGAGKSENHLTDSLLTAIRARVGMDKVISTAEIVELQPGMRLDLAAIAKGYGVDAVAEALANAGIKDFMVEVGGEVRVEGRNPMGDEWHIQIDAPIPDATGGHEQLTVLELSDCAIATSGNYRNFRIDTDGKTVYHTISPVTGRPADSDLLSATVIAPDCATADALATACMVMGLDEAGRMIRSLGTDYRAVLVSQTPDGEFEIHRVN